MVSEPHQDRAGLRHSLAVDLEHRNFAHRVDVAAPTGIALLAAREIDADRRPVEAGAIQIQRDLEGISGRADAIEFVLSRGKIPCVRSLPDVGTASRCCHLLPLLGPDV